MNIFHPPLPDAMEVEKKFLRRMGYKKGADIPANVLEVALPALKEVLNLAKPTALYEITSVDEVHDNRISANGLEIESALWAKLVGQVTEPRKLVIFALTMGQALEDESAKIQNESMAKGYFMHEGGAQVAELTADIMQDMIAEDPEFEGLVMTRRFSPGYCDWPVIGQKEIFGFIDPGKIGIKASSGWGMIPSKSITGVIVFGPSRPYFSPCSFCDNKTCDHRRG